MISGQCFHLSVRLSRLLPERPPPHAGPLGSRPQQGSETPRPAEGLTWLLSIVLSSSFFFFSKKSKECENSAFLCQPCCPAIYSDITNVFPPKYSRSTSVHAFILANPQDLITPILP